MEAHCDAHKELYLGQIIHATMRFMKLIPAPLSTSKEDCKAQFSMLLPYFSHFQIDIQDGIYVPNKTISLSDYLEVLHEVIVDTHTSVIPGSSRNLDPGIRRDDNRVVVDIHLMLSDYNKTLEWIRLNFLDPGIRRDDIALRCIFVHSNIAHTLFEQYGDLPLAMTFSPPDKPEDWTEYLQSSKYAQVMTIFPGPQGQTFMPEMLDKVGQIHEINPHMQVCIDGAVNEVTYHIVKSQPSLCIPDELAVGSYFSKATSENILSRIGRLSA